MKKQLILLASPTLRQGPLSPLQRFVRDYEAFLQDYEIFTTEGCRRALLRSGLLLRHQSLEARWPGYAGGVVDLSYLVVNHPEGQSSAIDAVIYLIDPKDPSSIFPETNAIKRECVVHGVTFLSTSRAAREWAAMNWNAPSRQFATAEDVGVLRLSRPIEQETIALIAHDGKKDELLQFAHDHFEFLIRFRARVATGTTGGLLNGYRPERVQDDEWAKLAPICTKLRQRIDELKARERVDPEWTFVDEKLTEKLSGPLGGDVMIARLVLAGKCQRIVFFENPLKPHEHTEDIQLLERTGRLRGKSTICVHDRHTAGKFVRHWEESARAAKAPRHLLSFVLERLFGVKCILAESSEKEPGKIWPPVRDAAAWFLLSQIAMLANDRKKLSEKVRVSVSWGVGSREIVDAMEWRLAHLRQIESARQRAFDLEPDILEEYGAHLSGHTAYQSQSLADPRYFSPGNVVVAPIQGLVGSEDERVEANDIAYRLKEIFGGGAGDHVPLAANVLVRKRERTYDDVHAHWMNTDIVLATAGPLVDEHVGRPRTPHFPDFIQEMRGLRAIGNVGPQFLDRWGKEVTPQSFEPRSMSADDLRRVHARGGVVLVVGGEEARTPITLAALLGRWVSVLVTDTEFARRLVREVADYAKQEKVKLRPPEHEGPLLEKVHA